MKAFILLVLILGSIIGHYHLNVKHVPQEERAAWERVMYAPPPSEEIIMPTGAIVK